MKYGLEHGVLFIACAALACCAFADGWSTHLFLSHGGSEKDPLFGLHPSQWRMWLEGTTIITAEILLAWKASLKMRWTAWLFATAFLVQAAIHLFFYFTNPLP
jgi:hypothetical protein